MGVSFASNHNTDNPLRIAVAANFTPVLKELLFEFHQQTNINTQIISGATGALFLQIKHGAPFDIYIAADSVRPKLLEQQNLILINSRKTYAIGQLALLSMHNKAQLSDLATPPKYFAIANPDIAPYGKAAKQTLQHLGLWQQYQNSLITGININQTFSQVRSQAVRSGLVANSQLVINKLAGVVIPSSYHLPIQQQLVIIKNRANIDHAKRLSQFLLSPKIQKKIVSFGYANNALPQQPIQQFTQQEKNHAKP
ncbi:molybdate ABC transporter substrate-binding protein [Candidatus Colwellia aromaticivorans]|uniref:molybdate ABC transporter substrate-binding protein n=1 Tax=Candidatus Colwellia aromaticivorans TaxID=2267621 RepID=UPI001FE9930C|nr:molybdate ABC transporter substrate-binding protein [Candidatus Colwellia aromaticivorans]